MKLIKWFNEGGAPPPGLSVGVTRSGNSQAIRVNFRIGRRLWFARFRSFAPNVYTYVKAPKELPQDMK